MLYRKQRSFGVILSVLFILLLAGWAEQVHSQEKYPTRAINIIVPYAPGGAADVAARRTADYLKEKWGVPVNVASKPGGRAIPGTLEVYQATPDGYTMLCGGSADTSMLAAAMATTKETLPFDIMNRTFIATIVAHPFVFFVPRTSPFKTLKDFVEGAKKNTKDISYTAGATALEYAVRQLFNATIVDISRAKAVMCKGAGEAVILVAGGHVTIGAAAVSTTLPAIKAETIRPLLIDSKKRWPTLPDLPTSAELGYPGVDTMVWEAIFGPPKLPSYISNIWDKAIQEMLRDPKFISEMVKTGGIPFYHNSQDTIDLIKRETAQAVKLFE